mmetsp:Transcript_48788/g.128893  ORF Transcript_48788/g.128893 Transcript_48788/m.128893 type:complete len:269 (+) Transcript_48788:3-809(+)
MANLQRIRCLSSTARDGCIYLVVGGNGGIGSRVVERILISNPKNLVAVACRTTEGADEFAKKISNGPAGQINTGRILPLKADVTIPGEVEACVSAVLNTYGRIDGVVNCAGSIILKPAHTTTEEEFNKTLSVNLNSCFSLLRCLARPMMKQKSGSIVFCSSSVAKIGLPNHEAIAAAKAGVAGLALSAASTYAKSGIRINVVSPGLTDTKLASRITGSEAALRASLAMHPLGRIAQPDEVASAIHFLLDHPHITGQVLAVDGGLSSLK